MNKKLLFLLFITVLSYTNSFGQYYPFLNNSSWNVGIANFGGGSNAIINSGVNVVIGSFTYRKITDAVFGSDVFIREDVAAKKVFRRVNNVDELLYDFSLNVGGTYTTATGSVYTVISITDTTVNGGTRRRFQLDNGFFGFTWIEGVGSPNHPLKPFYELPSDPYIYLLCSAQNGTAVYNQGLANGGTPTDCSMLNVDENLFLKESINLAPNPFTTELKINSSILLQNATLKISNTLGQVVKEITAINGQELIVDRTNLNSGLYFIQMYQNGKLLLNSKILIED